jgi:tetratricopeptide (TPR) repeat protein
MTLALHLLGSPQLELRGRMVKLGIKPMLVLAYLALEGRASRRDLARLLWSNATDPLNSVSAARVTIRDAIKKWLEGDNETLNLKHGFSCDINTFLMALNTKQPEVWQSALALHQGDFLEGIRLPEWDDGFGADFEEWLFSKREQILETKAELSWRLARHYLTKLDFENALPLLETTQAENLPPREDATRLLMLTAGALNREVRAQTAYAKLERRLQDELELSPSRQTRTALQLARGNREGCVAAIRNEFQAIKPTKPNEDTYVPLFGRKQELQMIQTELEKAKRGLARIVLLVGEPGVGKSRLATESIRVSSELFVLHGIASPTGVSLGLFDRIVRKALTMRDTSNFNRVWQQALAAFVPDAINSTQLEPSKDHLFAAITALLTHPNQTTALMLDDLQWADKTSIELLLHLMHASNPHGLLILSTLRNTETPRSDLKSVFELFTRENLGLRLEINGLNQEAVAELANALGSHTDSQNLYKQSGGNPFFLLELLRVGKDTHQLHDLVKSRLAILPETAQQLLEVAALLGNGSTITMLRTVSGRSSEEILDDLDHLANADVLHLLEEGTRFKHDLIREVVLEETRPARKQILHLRAARALKPNQAGNHALASAIAWDENDTPKMLLAFLETGKQHSVRGDLTTALEWFGHAEQHSRNATERLQALTERASALERYGRHEAALETLDKVAVLEGSVTDPVLRSGAWLARANLLALKMHRLEEAQVLVSQAFNALEGLSYSTAQLARSDALNIQGTIYRLEKKYADAAQAFEASLSIRQALEEDVRTAKVMTNLAMTYTQLNDSRAEKTHKICLDLFSRIEDEVGITKTQINLGRFYTKHTDYNNALVAYNEALRLSQSLHDLWAEARAYLNIGVTYFYLSDYRLATKHYELALEKAVFLQDSENQLLALLNLLEVSQILKSDSTVWLEQIKPFASNVSFSAYRTEINNYLSQQGVKL